MCNFLLSQYDAEILFLILGSTSGLFKYYLFRYGLNICLSLSKVGQESLFLRVNNILLSFSTWPALIDFPAFLYNNHDFFNVPSRLFSLFLIWDPLTSASHTYCECFRISFRDLSSDFDEEDIGIRFKSKLTWMYRVFKNVKGVQHSMLGTYLKFQQKWLPSRWLCYKGVCMNPRLILSLMFHIA